MDANQNKIIELLREVHLIAFKEIERLNMRIAELEIQNRQPLAKPVIKQSIINPATADAATVNAETVTLPSVLAQSETVLMNEHEVAAYIRLRVASVSRWRLLRPGPLYVKIGSPGSWRRV